MSVSAPKGTKLKPPRLGRIVYARSGRWWTASMPSFPGAYSQGRTQADAYRNLLLAIRELIETYVDLSKRSTRRSRSRSAA